MGIRLIYVLMDLYKDKFEFLPPGQEGIHPFFDHLAGTDESGCAASHMKNL